VVNWGMGIGNGEQQGICGKSPPFFKFIQKCSKTIIKKAEFCYVGIGLSTGVIWVINTNENMKVFVGFEMI